MKITKEEILERTDGGIGFYQLVIPDLKVNGTRCKNELNPFYKDGNPSLCIYKSGDRWYYKDYGEPDFSGDVFSFAAAYYKLDIRRDFLEILEKMQEELEKAESEKKKPEVESDRVKFLRAKISERQKRSDPDHHIDKIDFTV
jgi:hypothetical protein